MAEEKQGLQLLSPLDMEITRAPDYKVVYANNIRVGHTAWDIQIALGHMDAVPNPAIPVKARVEDLVALVLTPANAKALSLILTKIVQDYEAAVGKIEVSDSLLQPRDLRAEGKMRKA